MIFLGENLIIPSYKINIFVENTRDIYKKIYNINIPHASPFVVGLVDTTKGIISANGTSANGEY